MTRANPPGQRQLVFSVSSDELAFLVVPLLLHAFALLVREAARLEADLRGFV